MQTALANAEMLADFADEATLSLRAAPADLAAFRRNPGVPEPINAVFRAVHSIKGCASFLELRAIKLFSHRLENTLDDIRTRKLELAEPLERALVDGVDLLDAMLVDASQGLITEELDPRQAEFLDRLGELAGASVAADGPSAGDLRALASEMSASGLAPAQAWAERLQALADGAKKSDEPSASTPKAAAEATPLAPSGFQGAALNLSGVELTRKLAGVVDFFVAVERAECDAAQIAGFYVACEALANPAHECGQIEFATAVKACCKAIRMLVESPIGLDRSLALAVWDDLSRVLGRACPPSGAARPAQPPAQAATATVGESAAGPQAAANKVRMLRVREDKLDQFVDDVSGLFITGELLKDLHARLLGEANRTALIEELRQITRSFAGQSSKLQESVVAMRRVSVAGLFSKFPPMARTLAGQLGKQISVHLAGETTEIDKSLVEDLDAPLTHMIRNVVDHALELPEERLARGAPEAGNLWLKAELTRTHVRIVVQDDGRGIDPARLRKKAVEKGILSAAQAEAISDYEAVRLIFHPGFSTAEKVSEISGRGVGMDVVRSQVQQYNGEIGVDSQVGVGTTFRLDIPLRKAVVVIDALRVRQSGQDFVIPFEYLREIVDLHPRQLAPVHGGHVALVRDKTYGAVSLAGALNLPEAALDSHERRTAVLVGCSQGEACLLVDQVLGHRQVVINGLNDVLPGVSSVAGVAPLGGGRLALVLSVPDLIERLASA